MINHRGVWLPDGEVHLQSWMDRINVVINGKPTYQYNKFEPAMSFVRNWRTAIDVGAHVGLWSVHMAARFKSLFAFEPVLEHRQCWLENMKGVRNVVLYPYALGAEEGGIKINGRTPGSSGDTGVDPLVGNITPMKRLDGFNFQDVDFIKVDCEGFEQMVVKGAVNTMIRCRPCVIVEQKPGMALKYGLEETGAVTFLEGLGAKVRKVISGDYIMAWDRGAS